ncbi:MAG: homocysteine S-methyltransferase family protein, partial [Myxococcales bacterium]|nr:homocysteine S-methyltransferase family protein [Myxococcales bacterium]
MTPPSPNTPRASTHRKGATEESRVVILDGALGTELEARGVPTTGWIWSANATLTHPEVVAAIHRDYRLAGADVATANTFRSRAEDFERAGLSVERARFATRRAVELARDGAGSSVVAGSIAPLGDCYRPRQRPSEAACRRAHERMVDWLAEDGCDLLLLETMNNLTELRIALEAAGRANLPVWCSLICDQRGELLSGESRTEALSMAAALGADEIGFNCMSPALLEAVLRGPNPVSPTLAYPNLGVVQDNQWSRPDHREPVDIAWATGCLERGVHVIGGCCGSNPQ